MQLWCPSACHCSLHGVMGGSWVCTVSTVSQAHHWITADQSALTPAPLPALLITGEGRTWATVSWHTAHSSHYNYWLYLQQLLRCYHWLFWTKLHFSLSAHVISYRSGPAQVFSPRPSQQNWQAARAQHWPATARPASTSGAESRPGPSSYHLETMFGLAPRSQVNKLSEMYNTFDRQLHNYSFLRVTPKHCI